MTTSIISDENDVGFYLCSFYGGEERGTCYQITDRQGNWTVLTEQEMKTLIDTMKERIVELP